MGEAAIIVRSQHSAIRDLLPFYSLDMTLFGIALVAAAYGFMRWLDPSAATTIAVGGYAGMALVNWTAKPSYFLVHRDQEAVLTAALEAVDYRHVPIREHWVPPLPRWLRWKFNYVKFYPEGPTIKVMGPANILRYLAAQLH